MFEHVGEQRLHDANSANQADVSSVKSCHEWDAREATDPRSDHAVGEPPMGVNQLRLEAASRPNSVDEIGAEESDQGESGGPGRGDVTRHVSRVGQLLVAARCVPESLDANALDFLCRRKT